jgi:hypothetical protein
VGWELSCTLGAVGVSTAPVIASGWARVAKLQYSQQAQAICHRLPERAMGDGDMQKRRLAKAGRISCQPRDC